MNKLKEVKAPAPSQTPALVRPFTDLVSGKFLLRVEMVKRLPFFLYLILLALIYIGNGYYAEDTVIRLNRMSSEMKELRSEYISTKSELMFRSKQSEVARLLESYGIHESVIPPGKLSPDTTIYAEN